MPKKLYVVTLTVEERSFLQGLVSKGKVAAHTRLHAQVLLKADSGPEGEAWKSGQIVAAFKVSDRTVERVRQRFVEEGLEAALNRRQYPARQLKIDGRAEAHLIAAACGPPPEGRQRWTLHLLADRLVELKMVESVSHETVRQTLKKTGLSRG